MKQPYVPEPVLLVKELDLTASCVLLCDSPRDTILEFTTFIHEIQCAGTSDQMCTRLPSTRPSHDVATVGDPTDRIPGTAKPDPESLDR